MPISTLTNLEDRLISDPLGLTRRELFNALVTAANELSRQQRNLPSAEAFARLERQRRSCLAAMEVIDRAWLRGDSVPSAHFR
jgi:secretion system chaperone SsaE